MVQIWKFDYEDRLEEISVLVIGNDYFNILLSYILVNLIKKFFEERSWSN